MSFSFHTPQSILLSVVHHCPSLASYGHLALPMSSLPELSLSADHQRLPKSDRIEKQCSEPFVLRMTLYS